METLHRVLAVIGGATLIGGGVWIFCGNLIRDYFQQHWKGKSDVETDKAKGLNAIKRIQPEQYARRQFEVCVELWNTLATLRNAVDALWELVTEENILSLNKYLRDAHTKLYASGLFLGPQEIKELEQAMRTLGDFGAGKMRLRDLISAKDLRSPLASIDHLKYQIDINRQYKEEFESIIKKVQDALRMQLSGQPEERNLVD